MSIPTPTPTTQSKESVTCPMDFILRMLMGPWTTYILYNLRTHGPQRFGELKRRVSGISAKMLTERLRTLEGAALVKRDYEATIPPKVTYSLTKRGGELDEVMDRLAEIAVRWEAEDAAQRAAAPPRPRRRKIWGNCARLNRPQPHSQMFSEKRPSPNAPLKQDTRSTS